MLLLSFDADHTLLSSKVIIPKLVINEPSPSSINLLVILPVFAMKRPHTSPTRGDDGDYTPGILARRKFVSLTGASSIHHGAGLD
jgi:hypothetical protein